MASPKSRPGNVWMAKPGRAGEPTCPASGGVRADRCARSYSAFSETKRRRFSGQVEQGASQPGIAVEKNVRCCDIQHPPFCSARPSKKKPPPRPNKVRVTSDQLILLICC